MGLLIVQRGTQEHMQYILSSFDRMRLMYIKKYLSLPQLYPLQFLGSKSFHIELYVKCLNCSHLLQIVYSSVFLCSPHLLTIRERISVGNDGGPVPVRLLSDLFDQAKEAIDESIESENGALTHFEVVYLLKMQLTSFSDDNFFPFDYTCKQLMGIFRQTQIPLALNLFMFCLSSNHNDNQNYLHVFAGFYCSVISSILTRKC